MKDVISFGTSSRNSMYAWLYAFNRWRNPADTTKYIREHEIRINELFAWRVIDSDKGYHYLFASSLRDAATRSGVKRKDIIRIQRCDPFFVLFNTPRPSTRVMDKDRLAVHELEQMDRFRRYPAVSEIYADPAQGETRATGYRCLLP